MLNYYVGFGPFGYPFGMSSIVMRIKNRVSESFERLRGPLHQRDYSLITAFIEME